MKIGLISPMGGGKSTVAQMLIDNNGFKLVKFADPLKDMLRAIGMSEEQIEGSEKELPCSLLMGKTPRHAMQTLGTEWGRDSIHPNLWVRLWAARAGQHDLVVADDCRFPNEAAEIRRQGGKLIQIVPTFDGFKQSGDLHSSEAYFNSMSPDVIVENDGSIRQLYETVYRAIWE